MKDLYEKVLKKEPFISYLFFEKEIHKLVIQNLDFTFDSLLGTINEILTRKFIIIRPLYGGYLKSSEVIKHMNFKFIAKRHIEKYLLNYLEKEELDYFIDLKEQKPFMCYVEIEIIGKDKEYAKIEANRKLFQLDNILRFMSGNTDENAGLGIFGFNIYLSGGYVCIDEDGSKTFSASHIHNSPRGIELDNTWFFPGESGNDKIWEIVSLTEHNEMQLRILKAVEWIGRAINERDIALSFLQCLFAIECLLQDQDDFINKSITAQIGEYVAFVVGNDLETRMDIEKLFRNLYKLRSKLAHGSYTDDITEERIKAIWLAKQIIINLLLKPEFTNINNKKELRSLITSFRYR